MSTTVRSNGSMLNRRPFKVLVCLVTLVAFLFNTVSYDLVWAVGKPSGFPDGGSEGSGGSRFAKDLRVDTFALPEYLGHVKDSYQSRESDKIVIHIQDAHCNYACQRQISNIVEYLNNQYAISSINLEGGAKDYDLSIFTDVKDKPLRDKAADYFVKAGLVNGAEYFAINNPDKVRLWGVEDTKLYIDNLSVYRESLTHKDEIDNSLKSLSRILSILKTKIYSKELLDFDMKYGAYKAGNMEFKEYLLDLITIAKSRGIDTKKLANITLLGQVLAEETNIDFKKADKERDILIDSMQKRLSKNATEKLVVKTVEFKAERISQKVFYDYLLAEAKQFDVDTSAIPEFKKYTKYVSAYDSVDKTKVIEEMDLLEDTVKASLCHNDKERELSLLSKNLALLKNIFNISLTKDDYHYYQSNKDSFNISRFIDFIKLSDEGLPPDIANLDRYREEISKFYDYSLKRDDAFVNNIKIPKAAILITGGFHTENLSELFKKQGVSYIYIMPNFKNANGYECPYFKILSGENSMRIVDTMPSVLKNALAPYAQLSPAMDTAVTKGMSSPQLSKAEYEVDYSEEGIDLTSVDYQQNLARSILSDRQFIAESLARIYDSGGQRRVVRVIARGHHSRKNIIFDADFVLDNGDRLPIKLVATRMADSPLASKHSSLSARDVDHKFVSRFGAEKRFEDGYQVFSTEFFTGESLDRVVQLQPGVDTIGSF